MNEQTRLENFKDMQWTFGSGSMVEAGRDVAREMLEINIDFARTKFFDKNILGFDDHEYIKGDCLSKLLDYYSLLEIAIATGYISISDIELVEEVLLFFQEGNVKSYCFLKYKSLLPIRLFERFDFGILSEYDNNFSFPLFLRFLDIYDFLRQSNQITGFLNAENTDTTAMFRALRQPTAENAFSSEGPMYILIEGYFRYIDFLQSLGNFLEEISDFFELQQSVVMFFAKLIDDTDARIADILKQTKELYGHYVEEEHSNVGDRERYEYEDLYANFVKTLKLLKNILSGYQQAVSINLPA